MNFILETLQNIFEVLDKGPTMDSHATRDVRALAASLQDHYEAEQKERAKEREEHAKLALEHAELKDAHTKLQASQSAPSAAGRCEYVQPIRHGTAD